MAKSLAEQLLSAGLVNEKKVKQVKRQKHLERKQDPKGKTKPNAEQQARLDQQRAEAAERDRELNRQRKAEQDAKAMRAQALQMLQHNKQPVDGDIRFNFTDPRNNKIKFLFVSDKVQQHLSSAKLAICAYEDDYYVVPRHVAEKVAERFAESLIYLAAESQQQPDEDDPYKDFPIPDDLMW
ncbi:DUF2058 domain-containing protein [Alkalimonas amylolytica]|uniref:Nucleoprotein/polynucleotide-associated enzyme n=1 Tax=Alkalimonas amylolytica TaxID=152573 RepID=A0A1H3ZHB0_ALKAM|nr:DUF2058 domain-containing protein [Alkalimonas amylolytica]SEA22928.1 hypothetical protein SAMN04488051_102182 [Alkalimonas amylolytica]